MQLTTPADLAATLHDLAASTFVASCGSDAEQTLELPAGVLLTLSVDIRPNGEAQLSLILDLPGDDTPWVWEPADPTIGLGWRFCPGC